MISKLRKFISWLFLKLVFAAFIAVSAITIQGLWLFYHDDPDFQKVHTAYFAGLQEQQRASIAARDAAARKLDGLKQELATQQDHAARAAALAAELKESETWWARLFGDRDQYRMNAFQLEHLTRIEADSTQAVGKLKRDLTQTAVALYTSEHELKRLNAQLDLSEEMKWRAVYYSSAAWRLGYWYILAGLALYFFAPTLGQLILYYRIAPRITRGRAVQLAVGSGYFPWLSDSRNVVETSLWPGETARVRKRYLKSVEEGVVRWPRLLLSWRFPLASLLSGFVHDENLRNIRAGRDYRLAFAHHKNPEYQMAIVHVPEGGSLVVRPSFLAGVILPQGQKLSLKRRWQLFRWQAWLTGQLCFLEFSGPCRLVVAGRPGLRVERLTAREDGVPAGCRTSYEKIIGFTPGLEYRLIRTPRFWNYYRWNQLLFDASFSGVGFILIQASMPGHPPGIWSATRNRARKLIGL